MPLSGAADTESPRLLRVLESKEYIICASDQRGLRTDDYGVFLSLFFITGNSNRKETHQGISRHERIRCTTAYTSLFWEGVEL